MTIAPGGVHTTPVPLAAARRLAVWAPTPGGQALIDAPSRLWLHEPVDPVQLRLFPPARPLLERFGRDFFRRIPATPGVYVMSGVGDRVLYIGQSGNLKARLNSYRHLHPERASRRLVRLVHEVRAITWEVCPSSLVAQLRENELLRLHRPKFNVMNTRPEHYSFVGVTWSSDELSVRLTKHPAAGPDERLYGAFKGLGAVRNGISALLRLLWVGQRQVVSPHGIPATLLKPTPPSPFRLMIVCGDPGAWGAGLDAFLAGRSDGLLERLARHLPESRALCPFQRALCQHDLESLRDFYRFGPLRSHQLSEQLGLEARLIPQRELDDLVVLNRA